MAPNTPSNVESRLDVLSVEDDALVVDLNKHATAEEDAALFADITTEIGDEEAIEKPAESDTKKEAIKKGRWQPIPPEGKSVAECIADENLHRVASVEAVVFDLTNKTDLADYNKLLTQQSSATNGMLIVEEQRQWSSISDNWKVFIKTVTYEFRKL